MELAIREAFLRFLAAILHNYKSYLRTGTRRPDIKAKDRNLSIFYDIDAFIRSRDSSSHQFYKELVQTQLFNDFIINISFLSELDSSLADALAFFDDCCKRINPNSDKDDNRLLDINRFISDQTVVILPPEPFMINNEKQEFSYTGLGELNLAYFGEDVCLSDGNNENIDEKNNSNGNLTLLNTSIIIDDFLSLSRRLPNTPIGVRSKAEKIQAQNKLDLNFSLNNHHHRSSKSWAYCLLSNSYAMWFIYLPIYIESCEFKVIGLNNTFKVLVKMQKQLLTQPDEVCFFWGGFSWERAVLKFYSL